MYDKTYYKTVKYLVEEDLDMGDLNLQNELNEIASNIKNESLKNDFFTFLRSPNQESFNTLIDNTLNCEDSWAAYAVAKIYKDGLFGIKEDSKQAIGWYKIALDFDGCNTSLTPVIIGSVGTLFRHNSDLNGEKEFLYSAFDLLVKNNDYINSYAIYTERLKEIASLRERNEFLSTIENILNKEVDDWFYNENIKREREELNALLSQNNTQNTGVINQESNNKISADTTENNSRLEQLNNLKNTNFSFEKRVVADIAPNSDKSNSDKNKDSLEYFECEVNPDDLFTNFPSFFK